MDWVRNQVMLTSEIGDQCEGETIFKMVKARSGYL